MVKTEPKLDKMEPKWDQNWTKSWTKTGPKVTNYKTNKNRRKIKQKLINCTKRIMKMDFFLSSGKTWLWWLQKGRWGCSSRMQRSCSQKETSEYQIGKFFTRRTPSPTTRIIRQSSWRRSEARTATTFTNATTNSNKNSHKATFINHVDNILDFRVWCWILTR